MFDHDDYMRGDTISAFILLEQLFKVAPCSWFRSSAKIPMHDEYMRGDTISVFMLLEQLFKVTPCWLVWLGRYRLSILPNG